MVALHGREDSLLDAARFQRFLRQANDAEVADVRKVGDNDYEISPHRTSGALPQPTSTREVAVTEEAARVEPAAALESGDASGRDNGQRLGVRFRRGSRARVRPGEVPLIGVVQIEAPEPAAATAVAEPEKEPPPARKPGRARAPRKKAAAAPGASETASAPAQPAESPAPRPRRARPRAKKKAE
jgi:hypothetical protein